MKRKHKPQDSDAHQVIQYILNNCTYSRRKVATRIGVNPKTLRDWESQETFVQPYMIDKVAFAAEFPLEWVPEDILRDSTEEDRIRTEARALFKEESWNRYLEAQHEEALQLNQFIDRVTS